MKRQIPSMRFLAFISLFLMSGGVSAAEDASPTTAAWERGNLLAPRAFRSAAAKVRASVVSIEGFGGVATAEAKSTGLITGDALSTGLILTDDGVIATSTFNFVRQPPVITVVLHSGERYVAKMLGRDFTRQLCLLKIDAPAKLSVPEFANRNELRVGQWAVAMGSGFGRGEPSLAVGMVSALHRIGDRAVQTDANTSPANYGGPLLDIDGRVMGLCVPLHPETQEAAAGAQWYDSGIGFAVPLAANDPRLAELKAGKDLHPAYLGVRPGPADEREGAVLAGVVTGSPAASAGLKSGDRVLALDDNAVRDAVHLRTLLARYYAGDTLRVTFERDEKTAEVSAQLAAPPAKTGSEAGAGDPAESNE